MRRTLIWMSKIKSMKMLMKMSLRRIKRNLTSLLKWRMLLVIYNLGKLAGFIEERSNSEKDITKAKIIGMFEGAGISVLGYMFGFSLMTILSNKHHK